MKKFYILPIIVALLSIFIFSACSQTGGEPVDNSNTSKEFLQEQASDIAVVYFLTADGNWLVPVTMSINSTHEVAETSVEKLLAGAPNDFLLSPIPQNTKLIDIYSMSNIIYVDLTEEILSVEPQMAQKAVDCLAHTVLFLNPNAQMQILVEGKAINDFSGLDISQPISFTYANSDSDLVFDQMHITCYFSDNMAMYLVPRSYAISLDNSMSKEEAIIYQAKETVKRLIKGSGKKGLERTIWPNTKLLDLTLNKNNLILNFSHDILSYGGGTAAETMLVNSLIYSLTEIPNVNSITILIEGEIQEYLPEGTDISKSLTAASPLNYIQ